MGDINELQEIKLMVKVDTYKALTNHIHNELKISKEDIAKMIDDSMIRIMEKRLIDSRVFERSVDDVVKRSIAKLVSSSTWNLESSINTAIQRAIGEQIMNTVRDQLKGISITPSNISKTEQV
jgi:hypothetical protein